MFWRSLVVVLSITKPKEVALNLWTVTYTGIDDDYDVQYINSLEKA